MSKSIKLTGAALEAATHINKATDDFNRGRKKIQEIAEAEVETLHREMMREVSGQLAILHLAIGFDPSLMATGSVELDLDYLEAHGLAFINIKDGENDFQEGSVSQTLS
jgi:hypothetical protein